MSTPYFPRTVFADPRDMPEFRKGLADLAAPGGFHEQAEQFRTMNDLAGNFKATSLDHVAGLAPGPDVDGLPAGSKVIAGPRGIGPDDIGDQLNVAMARANNSMNWFRTALDRAQLIHVSEDLCDVLFSAHDSVPGDTTLTMEMSPAPFGLVVFAHPFVGIDSGTEFSEVRVDAVLWGPVKLPPRDEIYSTADGVVDGVAIAAYRYINPYEHTDEAAVSLRKELDENQPDVLPGGSMWTPLGRSDWVIGDTIDTPVTRLRRPRVNDSRVDGRRPQAARRAVGAHPRETDGRPDDDHDVASGVAPSRPGR